MQARFKLSIAAHAQRRPALRLPGRVAWTVEHPTGPVPVGAGSPVRAPRRVHEAELVAPALGQELEHSLGFSAVGSSNPLGVRTNSEWNEDRGHSGTSEERPSDLSGQGAAVHQVTQRRDDMRDGIDPRHGLEPSRKTVDGNEGVGEEG